jgi:hypothetical protein
MFSPPEISWFISGIKHICLHLFPVFYLIQPSSKQFICFDLQKQNSVLPIVFYVPCFCHFKVYNVNKNGILTFFYREIHPRMKQIYIFNVSTEGGKMSGIDTPGQFWADELLVVVGVVVQPQVLHDPFMVVPEKNWLRPDLQIVFTSY